MDLTSSSSILSSDTYTCGTEREISHSFCPRIIAAVLGWQQYPYLPQDLADAPWLLSCQERNVDGCALGHDLERLQNAI